MGRLRLVASAWSGSGPNGARVGALHDAPGRYGVRVELPGGLRVRGAFGRGHALGRPPRVACHRRQLPGTVYHPWGAEDRRGDDAR